MTDHTGFWRAIAAHPFDDGPRMVYADWLEENGEGERAEFIRVSCGAAKEPVHPNGHTRVKDGRVVIDESVICSRSDCRRCYCRLREWKLLEANWHNWYSPIGATSYGCRGVTRPPDDSTVDVWLTFRRGFPEHVELTCDAFMGLAADLFRAAPITSVRLTDKEPLGALLYNADRPYPRTNLHRASDIPCAIYRLLKGILNNSDRCALFDTRAAALQALSDACVAFGRQAAGLPEPTRKETVNA